MKVVLIQILIVGVWGMMFGIQARRLIRLAHLKAPTPYREVNLRRTAARIWWWLGRPEFWRAMQDDILTCVQATLMVFILAWSTLG